MPASRFVLRPLQPASLSLLLALFCSVATAQTESVLYSFTGANGDGSQPAVGLTRDSSGALYGTTMGGGTYGEGTVFKLTPPAQAGGSWTEQVLYSFNGAGDGKWPLGKLAIGEYGILYGTTYFGGNEGCDYNQNSGCGLIFRLKPPASSGGSWTYRTIYKFLGGTGDGGNPDGGVVIDSRGNLYGTTRDFGAYSGGVVYQLSPPTSDGGSWTETIPYSFKYGYSLDNELGNLAMDASGNLYGAGWDITGVNQYGTIFELSPPQAVGGSWTYTQLYAFTGTPSGAYPDANLRLGQDGVIFGATYWGGLAYGRTETCGTVFKLSPPTPPNTAWTERSLYKFRCASDGGNPAYGPGSDGSGNLYVTTTDFGDLNTFGCPVYYPGCGTVAKLAPPTVAGGAWTTSVLYAFTGGTDGGAPIGPPVLDSSGNLYDAAAVGGLSGAGVVYEIAP